MKDHVKRRPCRSVLDRTPAAPDEDPELFDPNVTAQSQSYYSSRRQRRYKALGLCPRCGNHPWTPPMPYCQLRHGHLVIESLDGIDIAVRDHQLDMVDAVDDIEKLFSAMGSERCRAIIVERFVVGSTLDQTGKKFGVTKERVRQIQIKAIREMDRYIEMSP